MRLQARTEFEFAGKLWRPGMIFDAPRERALELINQDKAVPYNLEDPSSITPADRLEPWLPEGETPAPPGAIPDVPPVTLSPTSGSYGPVGGTGGFSVMVTGAGASGTWTVDKDGEATWLTVTSPLTPQTASGQVTYNVSSNTGGERTGHFYVNGKTYTVVQAGVA